MKTTANTNSNQEDVREICDWLVDQGFPFDYHTSAVAPRSLLRPLAEAWARAESNDHVEEYIWAMEQEQEWAES